MASPADPAPGGMPGEAHEERETVVTTTVTTTVTEPGAVTAAEPAAPSGGDISIDMPLRPSPEQVVDAAMRLVAVGEIFSERLKAAVDSGNKRDNRRRLQIYLITAGLLVDIILTVVVFSIVQSNHTTANRLAQSLAAQQQIQAEVIQTHANAIAACEQRNRADAARKATLLAYLKIFGTTIVGQEGIPSVNQIESQVRAEYAPVNCQLAFPLPSGPALSPAPSSPAPG